MKSTILHRHLCRNLTPLLLKNLWQTDDQAEQFFSTLTAVGFKLTTKILCESYNLFQKFCNDK